MNKKFHILLLIIAALIIRVINFSFPSFTPDEARIAYRGFTLASYGKDELGRTLPLLFNASEDYQLPMVSYLTAFGELVFGKSEFGARILYIMTGTLLVLLVYLVAKRLNLSSNYRYLGAVIVTFSPTLIFLSKVPNSTILLTFIFTLILYLSLIKAKKLIIVFTMVVAVLISKNAWFILVPFVIFNVFYLQRSWTKRESLLLIVSAIAIVFTVFTLFLSVPQAERSLSENNFPLFSDVTIKNGIDRLRGQGLESGLPAVAGRLLFNKVLFLTVGLLQWLSNISPAAYFGQIDASGEVSYSSLGTWAKVLIIPFGIGLFSLLGRQTQPRRILILLFVVLTFPSIFIYPNFNKELTAVTLPFMALIISYGAERINKKVMFFILLIMILEIFWNISILNPEYKNTTVLRPTWIKEIVNNLNERSSNIKVAISDDIVSDIVPYIEWYTAINPVSGFEPVDFPYKFRQYELDNIKIIGSDENFTTCSAGEDMEIFASNRDLNKIKVHLDIRTINIFKDINGIDKAYLLQKACIR